MAKVKKVQDKAERITAKKTKPSPKTKAVDRDPRLPSPGTVIERVYQGEAYRLRTTEGSEVEVIGVGRFKSLSGAASQILGGKSVNGFVWWGLVKPKSNIDPLEALNRGWKRYIERAESLREDTKARRVIQLHLERLQRALE